MKKIKQKPRVVHDIIDTVPFNQIDPRTGIIEVQNGFYSKSYRLSDVNYSIAKENEQVDIYEGWCKFLNLFEGDTLIQVSVNNKNLDVDNFETTTLLKASGDKLDKYREDYNQIVSSKINEGKNAITREKYITITVPAKNFEAAKAAFVRMDRDIAETVKRIQGSNATPIPALDRLKILHDLYNVGREGTFIRKGQTFSIENAVEQGIDPKALVIPQTAKFHSKYFKLNDKFCATLYISLWASSVSDNFLSDLSNINNNLLISMCMKAVSQVEARKMVRYRLTDVDSLIRDAQKKAYKQGVSPDLISPSLKEQQTEATYLLNDISNRNQRLFLTNLLITVYADNMAQLEETIASVRTVGNKYGFSISTYSGFQEDAFNSCLPIGNNLITDYRTITTEAAGTFLPFTSQELAQPEGMYYGLNTISRNLIKYNRLSGTNYNALIFGQPGSGKSFAAKREITNTYIKPDMNADVIIIDPEDEYGKLAKLFGGEIINIKSGGIHHVNPFDLDQAYAGDADENEGSQGSDPLAEKQSAILSMMEMILASPLGITPGQRAIIDRALRHIYEDLRTHGYDPAYTPTMREFYEELLKFEGDPDAYELAKALELYVDGTLNLFSYKTNVNTKSDFIVYNLKDCQASLKPLTCLIITDSIWNRICKNRALKKPTFLYIDEAHLLFKSPQTANFINMLYKRARKYRGAITCITQNTSDVLNSPEVGTLMENTSFIEMLSLSYQSSIELATILNISETQMQFCRNTPPGEGLLYIQASPGQPSGIIPFVDKFPQDSELFKAFDTRNIETE